MGEMTNQEYSGRHAFRAGTADPTRCGFPDCGASPKSPVHDGWPQRATDPATDPATDDDVHDLIDRIIRRSHYVALKVVLEQLDGAAGWEHKMFRVSDVRRMVNDAADALRVPRPYRGA